MKKEEFFYFPRAEIGYIGNYIQTVVPFVIDESLDLYNLLRKLINYCNELGERNNELQLQMQKLVEFLNRKLEEQRQYIENFLTALYKEWTDFRTELNERYDAFVKEVERRFQEYREWILQEYQRELEEIRVKNNELYTELKDYVDTKVPELIEYVRAIEPRLLKQLTERQKAIETVIQGYADRFNEFENTITEKLERYNNELNDLITEKITDLEQKITEWQLYFQGEIDELNNRIDREKSDILSQADSKYEEKVRELETFWENLKYEIDEDLIKPYVEQSFNTLINTGIIDEFLQKAYGSIQNIYSLNGNTTEHITSDVPLYDYNTETHVLTDLSNGVPVEANKNSIYNYHGRLFVCTGTEIDLSIDESEDSIKRYNLSKNLMNSYGEDPKLLSYDENNGTLSIVNKYLDVVDTIQFEANTRIEDIYYRYRFYVNTEYENVRINENEEYSDEIQYPIYTIHHFNGESDIYNPLEIFPEIMEFCKQYPENRPMIQVGFDIERRGSKLYLNMYYSVEVMKFSEQGEEFYSKSGLKLYDCDFNDDVQEEQYRFTAISDSVGLEDVLPENIKPYVNRIDNLDCWGTQIFINNVIRINNQDMEYLTKEKFKEIQDKTQIEYHQVNSPFNIYHQTFTIFSEELYPVVIPDFRYPSKFYQYDSSSNENFGDCGIYFAESTDNGIKLELLEPYAKLVYKWVKQNNLTGGTWNIQNFGNNNIFINGYDHIHSKNYEGRMILTVKSYLQEIPYQPKEGA